MRKALLKISVMLACCLSAGCNSPSPPPVSTPPVLPPSGPTGAAPLAWEKGHPERRSWSQTLRDQIAEHLSTFDGASDITNFCPGYAQLPADDRVHVLATIAVGIAKFESGYDPTRHFGEPPPLGYDSIGLFQLSYEDGFSWCAMDRASKTLEEPINNIRCAVPEMARLVAADQIIAAGVDKGSARGLARYWSVVREGSRHHHAAIRGLARALPKCR